VNNRAGATEIARPVGEAVALVVVVECVGGVGNLGVGTVLLIVYALLLLSAAFLSFH
jgi:hypothetical protein